LFDDPRGGLTSLNENSDNEVQSFGCRKETRFKSNSGFARTRACDG
jgi:hypothetical protein